mgnify:CR=1 FL=1
MSWVAVATGVGSLAAGILNKKQAPGTAALSPVDLQAQQKAAIQGNMANESSIEALLNRSNTFAQGQANSLMEQAMPGYTALAGKLTGLASDLATNPYDLPPDVQANLQRKAAEMGVSTGRQGQAGDFSLLQDLGVNELNYGQSRIQQAQGLTGLLASIAPKVNPMSPMSFYVTPGQTAQIASETNQAQQQIAQSGLNANAAAANANSQSLWDSLAFSGGAFASLLSPNKNGPGATPTGTTTPPAYLANTGPSYGTTSGPASIFGNFGKTP